MTACGPWTRDDTSDGSYGDAVTDTATRTASDGDASAPMTATSIRDGIPDALGV